jgi:hypothetical protein
MIDLRYNKIYYVHNFSEKELIFLLLWLLNFLNRWGINLNLLFYDFLLCFHIQIGT